MIHCFLCMAFAMAAVPLIWGAPERAAHPGVSPWPERIVRLGARVGSAPLFSALLGWESWRICVAALRERAALSERYLGEREASGLLIGVLALASCALAWLLGVLWAAPLLFCAGFLLAPVGAQNLERHRKEAIARAMPDLLRSLSSSLGAGQTLTQAIGYVGYHTKGEAGRAFVRASLEVQCGMSVAQALQDLEASLDAPGVSLLACALVVSQRTGAPLDGLLRRSAELVEEQATLKAELATKTAQVRLSARLVMVMPILLVGFLAALTPDYRAGLATPLGAGCLVVAAVLDVVALLSMRKIMAGVRP